MLADLAQYASLPFSMSYMPLRIIHKNAMKVTPIKAEETRLKIVKLHDALFFPDIKQEVASRRISLPLASKYLNQVYLQDRENPSRKLNGFGFKNDKRR